MRGANAKAVVVETGAGKIVTETICRQTCFSFSDGNRQKVKLVFTRSGIDLLGGEHTDMPDVVVIDLVTAVPPIARASDAGLMHATTPNSEEQRS